LGTDSVLLGAWADVSGCGSVLDVGTGTGVVALMLAQRLLERTKEPGIRVIGVEIHSPSAACARRNFGASPWREHVEVETISIRDFARRSDLRFDLIVSNPPFFSEKTVSPDESRRLGRSAAALSQEDLLSAVLALLKPGGRLCVILPVWEGRRFCELAVPAGLYCTEEVAVRTRAHKPVERLLLRFERNPYPFQKKELVLYAEGSKYTPEFQELTVAFYLN